MHLFLLFFSGGVSYTMQKICILPRPLTVHLLTWCYTIPMQYPIVFATGSGLRVVYYEVYGSGIYFAFSPLPCTTYTLLYSNPFLASDEHYSFIAYLFSQHHNLFDLRACKFWCKTEGFAIHVIPFIRPWKKKDVLDLFSGSVRSL